MTTSADIFETYLEDRVRDDPPLNAGIGQPVTAPTTVFRVEFPNGNGPYNSGLPNAHEIYEALADYEAPEMNCVWLAAKNHENMNVTGHAFREAHGHADYGCDSVEALNRWFPIKARKYLAEQGAGLIEYEIPVGGFLAKTGLGEVIFDRHAATKVQTLNLVTAKRLKEKEMADAA